MGRKKKIEPYVEPPIPREALRWTEPVEPDLMPPDGLGVLVKGWLFNAYTGAVSRACTSGISHSASSDKETTTQQPRSLFSTELLALRAMRHAIELECARRLAGVDDQIAALSRAAGE